MKSTKGTSMTSRAFAICAVVVGIAGPAAADLVPGLLNDFEDGTPEGWESGGNTANVANGGPQGVGDGYLEISPGSQSHIAAYTLAPAGAVDPAVFAVAADLMRPAGEGNLQVRFVLFGPDEFERWTSSVFQTVPADGVWRTYGFSILEADLTHVLGTATYADLTADLNRIMFRYDPAAPSSGGTPGIGVLNVDNVTVVPEPSTGLMILTSLVTVIALTSAKPRGE